MKNHRNYKQWYWMSTTVFVLGIVSAVVLYLIHSSVERQKMDFEQVDAIMDVQNRAAAFHLWFEEAITKNSNEDMEKALEDFNLAVRFQEALLFGGKVENGTILTPLDDPIFVENARSVRADLDRLKELALKRAENPKQGGIGSTVDNQFNAVFREFERRARELENAVEKDRMSDQAKENRLFIIIALIWAIIVIGSVIGLRSREVQLRQAALSLESAYEDMEQRVKARTAELEKANIKLYEEMAQKNVLQAEALRAAHLASIGELAAGVAHEINNPINCIINYAQIMIDKRAGTHDDAAIPIRILKEGSRIETIVKSLLSFAVQRKEEKKLVRVHEVLADSLALSATQLRKDGILLNVDMPEKLPGIVAHPQQLQQVFMNIINNARYALNQKYPGTSDDKILEIRGEEAAADEGGRVKITFYDRGTGIPSDKIDKVVNPFFTTKPLGEGTGLGLSISHGIISDHGGRLLIQSVEGQFTKVQVLLPAERREGAGESMRRNHA